MPLRLLSRALLLLVFVAAATAVTPVAATSVAAGSETRNPEGLALLRAPSRGLEAAARARSPEGLAMLAAAVTPASPRAERAASYALEAVGVPYRWGGESPANGFDCSGLVRWAYKKTGIVLPHNSQALYGVGERIDRSELEAGDVLFFRGLGHVGLYVGRGRMIHAPYSGKRVEVIPLATTNYGERLVGARRMTVS